MASNGSQQGLVDEILQTASRKSDSASKDEALAKAILAMYSTTNTDLPTRTRVSPEMVMRTKLAIQASRLIGFSPLEEDAMLTLQLLVSLDGMGRGEAVQMFRAFGNSDNWNDDRPKQNPALA